MASKVQNYLLTVAILEGKHYIWTNMNSAVIVRVGNQKKCTSVKYHTDAPFYNEYFVFEFVNTFEKVMEKQLTLTVVWPKSIVCKRRILGYISLDLATIWNQKNHQFYHKWAVLTSPKSEVISGGRGYLKVDIAVLAKGEAPVLPLSILNDDIEANLLVASGFSMERERVQYIFEIYRCEHLVHKPSNQVPFSETAKSKNASFPSTFVEITFAGNKARTSIVKHTNSPVFNEKITIIDLFPPLCQRIKIEIFHHDCARKTVLASHCLNLNSLSNDNVEGFLPTYGPSFIYLYKKQHLEGYAGSLLIAMKTELDEAISIGNKIVLNHSLSPINEDTAWAMEEVFLFAMLLEVSGMKKKYFDKNISFRITFGHILTQKRSHSEATLSNSTVSYKPLKSGKNYCHLWFGAGKPCMILKSKWPDCRPRMYNVNMLAKIVEELNNRMEIIEDMFIYHPYKKNTQETYDFLAETLDIIRSSCLKYIDIVSTMHKQARSTRLDEERIKMCLTEMRKIIEKTNRYCCMNSRKLLLNRIQKIYSKLLMLMDSPQHCWPDIFLWMIQGNKKVACIQIPSSEIAFSPIPEEKGIYCGRFRSVFLNSEKEKTDIASCKARVMFWVGLDRHKQHCLETLPKGFKVEENDLDNISVLAADEGYHFTCRAHIFQGKFRPGFDKSSMLDAFVQILVRGQVKETITIKQCLNPIWDQMIVFKNISLFGSKEFIKQNVPSLTVQVFDKDACCKIEFVGKNEIAPSIKFTEDKYEEPRLKWHKMFRDFELNAELLAAFELIEVSQEEKDGEFLPDTFTPIPPSIKPNLVSYKIEIVFWGIRNLKKVNLCIINRPRITVHCANKTVNSEVIENAKKHSNFASKVKTLEVVMPEQKEYTVPMRFKMYDSRKFGIYTFSGVHICDVSQFMYTPLSLFERQQTLSGKDLDVNVSDDDLLMRKLSKTKLCKNVDQRSSDARCVPSRTKLEDSEEWDKRTIKDIIKSFLAKSKKSSEYSLLTNEEVEEIDESEDYDWWTKFYASLEDTASHTDIDKLQAGSHKHKLKIYPKELELQPEFESFSDMLRTFELFKGKRTGDEELDEENVTGVFKGSVSIYRWPPENDIHYVTASGLSLKEGVYADFPENFPLQYITRVYCVRAIRLTPRDLNNKSDPYLVVTLNNQIINDRENRALKQIDPIFGRCFEFFATFPSDHTLKISVWDYDITTSDDLIGETEIDLENRFYSKYRAGCGIADTYQESGYCRWRDQQKPSAILTYLCKKWRLEEPIYNADSVKIGAKEFFPENFNVSVDTAMNKEVLALSALRNWHQMPIVGYHLVPEHVETRSLYNPEQPGIEQGKLQLWIDIFACADVPPPKQVVITPRIPVKYELRVTIWNTEEVLLDEDDFFVGERKSDIYVKGWMADPNVAQNTDVHYRSLTGEGNFNWRFVFEFEYLSSENKQVFNKKENIFALSDTEFKIPCRLNLQVLDNDTFSADDFLGALTMELSKMPKGARSPDKCSLEILEFNSKKINLFKLRRTKGWWPFKYTDSNTKEAILAGKLEAEFELLVKDEAEKQPVGLGRKAPQELPPPKRPDTSFSWFKNPLRAFKFVCCKIYKWKLIKAFLFLVLVFVILAAIYSVPGYSVKRILGA